jgi:hypothetical protein
MTKIKKSITISGELDNVLARLASKLDQTTSELIEIRLREDPQIKTMLQELRVASESPEHENKTKKPMIAS